MFIGDHFVNDIVASKECGWDVIPILEEMGGVDKQLFSRYYKSYFKSNYFVDYIAKIARYAMTKTTDIK